MSMIERVAKAVYEGRNGKGCTAWGHLQNAHKAPYLTDARAAIEAMREPTHEMGIAGMNADDRRTGFETCCHIYRAMNRAALEDSDG